MGGRRLRAHAGRGERALDVAGADRLSRLGQGRHRRGHRPAARPTFGQWILRAAIVEADAAFRVVMGDDEEGVKMRQRPLIDAFDQALRGAEQPAAGDEEYGQQRRQRRGQHALLDDHASGRVARDRGARSGR